MKALKKTISTQLDVAAVRQVLTASGKILRTPQAPAIVVKKATSLPKEASSAPRQGNPRRASSKAKDDQPKAITHYAQLERQYQQDKEHISTTMLRYYCELFGEEELPQGVPLTMVDLKIVYELLRKGYEEMGMEPSDKFVHNYNAAQALDVSKFTETQRGLVRADIEEETGMKKANVAKGKKLAEGGHAFKRSAGKTLGFGVAETWAHLFAQNEKLPKAKRLTDEGITAFLNKEFPDKQSAIFRHVSTVRSRYNRGVLTKGSVPATKSSAYDEKGEKIEGRKAATPKKAKKAAGGPLEAPKKLVLKKGAPAPAAPAPKAKKAKVAVAAAEEEVVD